MSDWSNNESLFIYILMNLLRTAEASAAVVFATPNTTRVALIQRFSESTWVRNELNHCMFIFDSKGAAPR